MADESTDAGQSKESPAAKEGGAPKETTAPRTDDLEALAARAGEKAAKPTEAPAGAERAKPKQRKVASIDDFSEEERDVIERYTASHVTKAREKWDARHEREMAAYEADPEGLAPSQRPGADPLVQSLVEEVARLKQENVQRTATNAMREFLTRHDLSDDQRASLGKALQGIADGVDRVFSPETVYSVSGLEMLARAHGVFESSPQPGTGHSPWSPTPGLEHVTPPGVDIDPLQAGAEGIAKVHREAEAEVAKNIAKHFGAGGRVTLGGTKMADFDL